MKYYKTKYFIDYKISIEKVFIIMHINQMLWFNKVKQTALMIVLFCFGFISRGERNLDTSLVIGKNSIYVKFWIGSKTKAFFVASNYTCYKRSMAKSYNRKR